MDIERTKGFINDFFDKIPTKDVYQKCLLELITEKHNIMSKEDYEKELIELIDNIIESIQVYLSVSTK